MVMNDNKLICIWEMFQGDSMVLLVHYFKVLSYIQQTYFDEQTIMQNIYLWISPCSNIKLISDIYESPMLQHQ